MSWINDKLKDLRQGVKALWRRPRGKLTVVAVGTLLVLSVPGLYFSFIGTPDKPACLKAENFKRTDTWWKAVQYHGFRLGGHPLECRLSDTDLMKYMIGTLSDPDDLSRQDGQESSKKIKALALHPDPWVRTVRVQMVNDALADVSFPAESNDRLKLRNELGPRLNVLVPTLPLEPAGFNWVAWGSAIIPVIVLAGVMLYLGRNQMGRMLKFKKSKHKVIMPGRGGPTFDDIAGAEEAKEALMEYREFLKNPEKARRLGAHPHKGVLLVGEPGNGKTLLARALAETAGVPFFSINGSDFTEMFVGVGSSRVFDMYEEAKKHPSCIIFVDEIDAVGPARKGASASDGNGERDQTLMALLNVMDGINEKGEKIDPDQLGIIWIAATNRPDVLDPALKRPGRLDRLITVPAPGLLNRQKVLAIHVRKIKLAAEVDLLEVARICPGYSGADLMNLANEAAIVATRRGANAVYMVDFIQARETIEMGAENRSLTFTPMEKLITSLHEGGHTLLNLAGEKFGHDPFLKVTNIPRGNALGLTWFRAERDKVSITKEELKAMLATLMGGRAAEQMYLGKSKVTSGAGGDLRMAQKRAFSAITDLGFADNELLEGRSWSGDSESAFVSALSEFDKRAIQREVTHFVREATATACQHLAEKQPALFNIVRAMYFEETLDRKRVLELIAESEAEGCEPLTWDELLAQTVGKDVEKLAA